MGMIPYSSVDSIKRGINSVSELTFSVHKYYGEENLRNPLYDELKTERFIELDNDECYVIKNISEVNERLKSVTAYSREKKLFKNMAEFERIITDKYNVACALAIGYNIMYNELYDILKQCNQGKKLEKFEKLKTFGGMAEVLSKKTADESLSSLLKTVGDDWAE